MSNLVLVKWKDSGLSLSPGWESIEEHRARVSDGSMTVVTAGFLMHEDEVVVMVGLSYDPDNDVYYGAQVIARECVISVTRLDEGAPK